MSNKKLLDKYVPMIGFLGIVCGPNFEIVLHDISTPKHSVIAVANNHISERTVGAPLTDLAISLIEKKEYEHKDFVCNYAGKTHNGKQLVSSTFFIKENGKLIGLLCINNDTSMFQEMHHKLETFLSNFALPSSSDNGGYQEALDGSIKDISKEIILKAVGNSAVAPERMTAGEKKSLIKSLYDSGVFSMRGTVPFVAKELFISEPTVYRYLKQIKASD